MMRPKRGTDADRKDSIKDDAMMTFGRRSLCVRKIKRLRMKANLFEGM